MGPERPSVHSVQLFLIRPAVHALDNVPRVTPELAVTNAPGQIQSQFESMTIGCIRQFCSTNQKGHIVFPEVLFLVFILQIDKIRHELGAPYLTVGMRVTTSYHCSFVLKYLKIYCWIRIDK